MTARPGATARSRRMRRALPCRPPIVVGRVFRARSRIAAPSSPGVKRRLSTLRPMHRRYRLRSLDIFCAWRCPRRGGSILGHWEVAISASARRGRWFGALEHTIPPGQPISLVFPHSSFHNASPRERLVAGEPGRRLPPPAAPAVSAATRRANTVCVGAPCERKNQQARYSVVGAAMGASLRVGAISRAAAPRCCVACGLNGLRSSERVQLVSLSSASS